MTDLYGVIGHPIAHSKSPIIHQQFATQTNQDLEYAAFDIHPEDLTSQINKLVGKGLKGLNVTVPHKNNVTELMDEVSERAMLASAVNTITVDNDGKLSGDNTDGIGLIRDLRDNLGLEIADTRILILGAGGATAGIVPALLEAEAAKIRIANRTLANARKLVDRFRHLGAISACEFSELGGGSFDLIINATSAGLDGQVPPFPSSIISQDVTCYDLSYAMTDTPFIAWAKDQGTRSVHQGWGMLVEQAAESFLIWRGVRPKTGPVRSHLP
jgi:shikimate dehydrogenase